MNEVLAFGCDLTTELSGRARCRLAKTQSATTVHGPLQRVVRLHDFQRQPQMIQVLPSIARVSECLFRHDAESTANDLSLAHSTRNSRSSAALRDRLARESQ